MPKLFLQCTRDIESFVFACITNICKLTKCYWYTQWWGSRFGFPSLGIIMISGVSRIFCHQRQISFRDLGEAELFYSWVEYLIITKEWLVMKSFFIRGLFRGPPWFDSSGALFSWSNNLKLQPKDIHIRVWQLFNFDSSDLQRL